MDDDARILRLWKEAIRQGEHAIAAICERALDGMVTPWLFNKLRAYPQTLNKISTMSSLAARAWCDEWLQIVNRDSLSDKDTERIKELAPWLASGTGAMS